MFFYKFHSNKKPFKNTIIIFRNKYISFQNRNSIMPKINKSRLFELQKQRKQIKALNSKYIPSRIFLQVIGNGKLGNPTCVILQTDHTNYLFNCGEGSQRLGSEHHVKLTKLEHIFVTRASWNNIGGILGTALTLQETGVPLIKLHGPEGIIDIIEATKSFVTLNQLQVVPANSSEQFIDHTMSITYVSVNNPTKAKENLSTQEDLFVANANDNNHEMNSNGKRTYSSYSSQIKNKNINPVSRIDNMMIYICKIHDKVGTLNIEKCINAGVEPGPNLGKLKSGIDITLSNGQIIKSKDMVSKSVIGPLFIVMECPNEDWIDNIIKNPVFLKHQAGTATDEDHIARVIVHYTPESVLNNSKYIDWMRKFGTETQHLIINEENSGFSSEAMHKMQYKLNLLHPTIFPLFDNYNENKDKNIKDNVNNLSKTSELKNSSKLETIKNVELGITNQIENELVIHHCKTLNSFFLRPFTGFETNSTVKIDPEKYVNEAFAISGFSNTIEALQTELNRKIETTKDLQQYPRLLMLGTGSSIPNKVRNTSGILLQFDEDRSMILDCGEGTVNQIIKLFGETEGYRVLKTIKAIYVSHLHADHHLGFIGILKRREQVTNEPVLLLAPDIICEFLDSYDIRFEPIKNQYQFIPLRALLLDQQILKHSLLSFVHETLNITKINTVYVKHCPNAYAIAITLKDGRKICYSGDTMPCEDVVKLAKNCFLLIHEATMEDDLITEAIVKRHSTISQAIETGEKAEVNFTLLTHFSQRYSKLPILPKNKKLNSVGISYDFMMISLSKIELLPLFYPALSILFKDFQAVLEERAIKREWKKECLKEKTLQMQQK